MLLNAKILGGNLQTTKFGLYPKDFLWVEGDFRVSCVEIYAELFTRTNKQNFRFLRRIWETILPTLNLRESKKKNLQATKSKVDLTSHKSDFIVKHIEDFLLGNLFKIRVQIDSKVMQAIPYIRGSQLYSVESCPQICFLQSPSWRQVRKMFEWFLFRHWNKKNVTILHLTMGNVETTSLLAKFVK